MAAKCHTYLNLLPKDAISSMYELLFPPGMRVLKGGPFKEKGFREFRILALFKGTLIRN